MARFPSAPQRRSVPKRDNLPDHVRVAMLTRDRIREARWPHGITCPRCGSSYVHRWCRAPAGGARYRCRGGCGRTFSDLTGTPLAYSKRLDRWGEAAACMLRGRSIRLTAVRAGVSPATAFRWRHRLLAGTHQTVTSIQLSGIVEIHVLHFPESFKGARPRGRPPRRREVPAKERRDRSRQIAAILARDRLGGWADVTIGEPGAVSEASLAQMLGGRIALPTTVCSPYRRAFASFCRHRGLANDCAGGPLRHPGVRAPLYHIEAAAAAGRSFNWWLRRFRGVATRYLHRYLTWHGLLDRHAGLTDEALRTHLILSGCVRTYFNTS